MPLRPTEDAPPQRAPRDLRGDRVNTLMRLATHLALSAGPAPAGALEAALEAAALSWETSRVALWRVDRGGALREVAAWPTPGALVVPRLPAATVRRLARGRGARWVAGAHRPETAGDVPSLWLTPIRGADRLLAVLAREAAREHGATAPSPWETALTEALGAILARSAAPPSGAAGGADGARAGHADETAAPVSPSGKDDGARHRAGERPSPPREPRGDLVVWWRASGRVTDANEAARRSLGLGEGARWARAPLGRPAVAIARTLAGEDGPESVETEGMLPDGSTLRWTHVMASRAGDGSGGLLSVGRSLPPTARAARNLEAAWAALHAVAARAIDADERVRQEVASELHDVAAQHLAAALLRLQLLASDEASDPRAAALWETVEELEAGIRALRSASRPMAAHTLRTRGLAPALEEIADRLTRWHGVPCGFEEQGRPVALSQAASLAAFRSAAELLANVARHARADRCEVVLRWQAKGALVEVRDDGVGLNAARAAHGQTGQATGLGLFTVRTRLHQVGGALQLGASPEGGTRAVIFVPAEAHEPEREDEGDRG